MPNPTAGDGRKRRFETKLGLRLEVYEITDANRKLFIDFDQNLKYADTGLDGVVAVEAGIDALDQTLRGFGFDVAIAEGLGDKLKALGLEKP